MRSNNTEFGKCVKNGYINVNLDSPKKKKKKKKFYIFHSQTNIMSSLSLLT